MKQIQVKQSNKMVVTMKSRKINQLLQNKVKLCIRNITEKNTSSFFFRTLSLSMHVLRCCFLLGINKESPRDRRLIRRRWTAFFRPITTDWFMSTFPSFFLTSRWTIPSISTATTSCEWFSMRSRRSIGKRGLRILENRWKSFTFCTWICIITFECTALTFTPEIIGAF